LGDRSAETLKRLLEKLKHWVVTVCCTDDLPAYAKEIENYWPMAHHITSKSETVAIERNNSDTRHWFARFHRRSKVVSRARHMIDATLTLFSRLRVDGAIALLRNWKVSLLT
jgi:IS1 family transposase